MVQTKRLISCAFSTLFIVYIFLPPSLASSFSRTLPSRRFHFPTKSWLNISSLRLCLVEPGELWIVVKNQSATPEYMGLSRGPASLEQETATTPVFLFCNSRGQAELDSYSPQGWLMMILLIGTRNTYARIYTHMKTNKGFIFQMLARQQW